MLAARHLTEFELAQLASLNPGEVEEARALVPSLEVGPLASPQGRALGHF